ncbi:hypothetical protein B0A77_08600 [Flavobacterium branchiophilum]|uniref:Uncharacterized protein n=1 Tax=Flavobacterium branchiophilum TaxID=55197 RepID=A0A2H3KCT5_9FLAO|nr:hypothetical protein B0A77_08600 [Flavobacterium branchiophilum]
MKPFYNNIEYKNKTVITTVSFGHAGKKKQAPTKPNPSGGASFFCRRAITSAWHLALSLMRATPNRQSPLTKVFFKLLTFRFPTSNFVPLTSHFYSCNFV